MLAAPRLLCRALARATAASSASVRVPGAVPLVRPAVGATVRAMGTFEHALSPVAGLSASAQEYHAVAKSFADTELAPFASKWDEEHFFPEEALRKAAALGFGGMYVSPDHGGSGLSRADSIPIVEALAGADTSTTA